MESLRKIIDKVIEILLNYLHFLYIFFQSSHFFNFTKSYYKNSSEFSTQQTKINNYEFMHTYISIKGVIFFVHI